MTTFDWIVLALILLILFTAPDRSGGGGVRGKPLRGRGKIVPPRSGTGFVKPKE
jgi:hypothetical protein